MTKNYVLRQAGYWISPYGKFFEVEQCHINTVCNHPKQFGTNERALQKVFKSYNEIYRSENNAREEIIRALVNQAGWIRLRNYDNSGWSVNVRAIDETNKALLTAFFREIYGHQPGFDTVNITSGNEPLKTDMNYFLQGEWLENTEPLPTVSFLRSAGEIPDEEVIPVYLGGCHPLDSPN